MRCKVTNYGAVFKNYGAVFTNYGAVCTNYGVVLSIPQHLRKYSSASGKVYLRFLGSFLPHLPGTPCGRERADLCGGLLGIRENMLMFAVR